MKWWPIVGIAANYQLDSKEEENELFKGGSFSDWIVRVTIGSHTWHRGTDSPTTREITSAVELQISWIMLNRILAVNSRFCFKVKLSDAVGVLLKRD